MKGAKFFLCTLIIFLSFLPIPTSTAFRIIPDKEIKTTLNIGESKNFIIEIVVDPNKPSDIGKIFVFTFEHSASPDTYSIVPSRSIIPYCKISYDKNAKLGDKKPVMAELSISVPSNIAKQGSFFGDLLIKPADAQSLIQRRTVHLFVTVRGTEPLEEKQKIEPEIHIDTNAQIVTANLKNTGELSFATEGGEATILNSLSKETIQTVELIPKGNRKMKTIFPENEKIFTGKIEKPVLGGNYDVQVRFPVVYPAIEEGRESKTLPVSTTIPYSLSNETSLKIWGPLPLIEIAPARIDRFFVGRKLSKKLRIKNNSTQKLKVRAEYHGDWLVVDPAEFILIGNREIYLDFKNPNGEEIEGEIIFTACNEAGEAVGEQVKLDIKIFGKK